MFLGLILNLDILDTLVVYSSYSIWAKEAPWKSLKSYHIENILLGNASETSLLNQWTSGTLKSKLDFQDLTY